MQLIRSSQMHRLNGIIRPIEWPGGYLASGATLLIRRGKSYYSYVVEKARCKTTLSRFSDNDTTSWVTFFPPWHHKGPTAKSALEQTSTAAMHYVQEMTHSDLKGFLVVIASHTDDFRFINPFQKVEHTLELWLRIYIYIYILLHTYTI